MELSRETMKRIGALILFAAVVLSAIIHMDAVIQFIGFVLGVLSPFLIGSAIAFVLNLPMKYIETHLLKEERIRGQKLKSMRRPISLILTILIVIGLFSLVILVVVPELVNTFSMMVEDVNRFIPTAQNWILMLFRDNADVQNWLNAHPLDVSTLLQKLVEFLQNGAGDFLSGTISQVAGVITGVVDFVLGFVFACYILVQKERLAAQARRLGQAVFSERHYERAEEICSLFYKSFSSFIAGQCMDAAILGVMFVVGMTIFRLPYALLIGVVIAFTAIIPVLGAFIGCVVGIVLILTVSPIQAVVFVILFLVLQQLEEHFVYPHVVGNSVGLPAIWVMAAVIIGGGLMGVIGMLVFIPLVSVLYHLLRNWMYRRLEEKQRMKEGSEFPEERRRDSYYGMENRGFLRRRKKNAGNRPAAEEEISTEETEKED